jgi:hypothetical protein
MHHVLSVAGVRKSDNSENERLTDRAMFVCGLGRVFLEGQTSITHVDGGYVKQHLGYHTEKDYIWIHNWTRNAWDNRHQLGVLSKLDELSAWFKKRYPDKHLRERIIHSLQERYPGRDDTWYLEKAQLEAEH